MTSGLYYRLNLFYHEFSRATRAYFAQQYAVNALIPMLEIELKDDILNKKAVPKYGTAYYSELRGTDMRIMAIDYGDAHTGVAISDLLGFGAGTAETIDSRDQNVVVERLKDYIRDYKVEELVLGYPKNMDGTLGVRAEKSEALAERLREETGLPVTLWDERRTTVDAHRILSEAGKHGRKRKQVVDAVAATLILEGYLTFKKQ